MFIFHYIQFLGDFGEKMWYYIEFDVIPTVVMCKILFILVKKLFSEVQKIIMLVQKETSVPQKESIMGQKCFKSYLNGPKTADNGSKLVLRDPKMSILTKVRYNLSLMMKTFVFSLLASLFE